VEPKLLALWFWLAQNDEVGALLHIAEGAPPRMRRDPGWGGVQMERPPLPGQRRCEGETRPAWDSADEGGDRFELTVSTSA